VDQLDLEVDGRCKVGLVLPELTKLGDLASPRGSAAVEFPALRGF
jgi:hypothetical protein